MPPVLYQKQNKKKLAKINIKKWLINNKVFKIDDYDIPTHFYTEDRGQEKTKL